MTRALDWCELNRRLARVWLTLILRGKLRERMPEDLRELLTGDEQALLRRRERGDS